MNLSAPRGFSSAWHLPISLYFKVPFFLWAAQLKFVSASDASTRAPTLQPSLHKRFEMKLLLSGLFSSLFYNPFPFPVPLFCANKNTFSFHESTSFPCPFRFRKEHTLSTTSSNRGQVFLPEDRQATLRIPKKKARKDKRY